MKKFVDPKIQELYDFVKAQADAAHGAGGSWAEGKRIAYATVLMEISNMFPWFVEFDNNELEDEQREG